MSMLLKPTDLRGMFPAITTPFTAQGTIDEHGLTALVERLVTAGVGGIVPTGGTGEYTAMSAQERTRVVEITARTVAGRVPVVAGVLSPGYAEALEQGRAFMQAGADGLLLVAPFYVHPGPEGLMGYFTDYAGAVGGAPILLYDIPARTGVAVSPETTARLAEEKLIIGMKACNTQIMHFERIMQKVGDTIGVLSGDDFLYPVHAALGAHGGILASSTLLPHIWNNIDQLLRGGSLAEGLALHRQLTPLLDTLFSETNPGPLKAALNLVGLPHGNVRLPLVPPGAQRLAEIKAALTSAAALCSADLPVTLQA